MTYIKSHPYIFPAPKIIFSNFFSFTIEVPDGFPREKLHIKKVMINLQTISLAEKKNCTRMLQAATALVLH